MRDTESALLGIGIIGTLEAATSKTLGFEFKENKRHKRHLPDE